MGNAMKERNQVLSQELGIDIERFEAAEQLREDVHAKIEALSPEEKQELFSKMKEYGPKHGMRVPHMGGPGMGGPGMNGTEGEAPGSEEGFEQQGEFRGPGSEGEGMYRPDFSIEERDSQAPVPIRESFMTPYAFMLAVGTISMLILTAAIYYHLQQVTKYYQARLTNL